LKALEEGESRIFSEKDMKILQKAKDAEK